jgi:hypothetical protein
VETYYRKLIDEEIENLKSRHTDVHELVSESFFKWITITVFTMIPFFIYYYKMSDIAKVIYLLADQMLIIGVLIYITKPFEKIRNNNKIKAALMEGYAEVTRITAKKIIECEFSDELFTGFFIDVSNGRTLFLQNEHFDRLKALEKFPNTEFEMVKTTTDKIFVDTILKGDQLHPVKKILHPSKNPYETYGAQNDWQLLEIPFDKIYNNLTRYEVV